MSTALASNTARLGAIASRKHDPSDAGLPQVPKHAADLWPDLVGEEKRARENSVDGSEHRDDAIPPDPRPYVSREGGLIDPFADEIPAAHCDFVAIYVAAHAGTRRFPSSGNG